LRKHGSVWWTIPLDGAVYASPVLTFWDAANLAAAVTPPKWSDQKRASDTIRHATMSQQVIGRPQGQAH
jgi:hypothetical protein